MASMNRYMEQAPANDGRFVERGFAADRLSLAGIRVHADADYAQSLTALIESEIIPRMMVAHTTRPASCPEGSPLIGADEIELFAPLVMQVEADELLAHVETLIARGVGFESVLIDLLAPTARLLGEYWTDDRCDFVDVTMGLWRLQEVVHEISWRMPSERAAGSGARRALFAPMPGEQHSLGTVMIDDIFRREGWLTDRLCDAALGELVGRVSQDWFDIIGLTVSCDCNIGPLRSTIAALRKASRNPHVCVMVGGRVFNADPDLAVHVGADGTAPDARTAPKVADDLVRERERAAAT